MSRASRARQIAMGAAYGGGGGHPARRQCGRPAACRGEAGEARDRAADIRAAARDRAIRQQESDLPPIRLAVLGDSSAAGLGVHRSEETPAVVIACGLADIAGTTR